MDAEIGELLVNSFVSTYAEKMPEVRVSEERIRDLRNVAAKRERNHLLIVETTEGQLAGTLTLFRPGCPDSRSWRKDTSDLRYFAVRPDFHGKGAAQALMDAAESLAWSLGAEGLSLHVRRGAHGLVRFYEGRGYRRVPSGDKDLLPEIYLEAYRLVRPGGA